MERRRRDRDEAFRRLEVESLLLNDEKYATMTEKEEISSALRQKTIPDLLDVIDKAEISGNVASRTVASQLALERMGKVSQSAFSDEDRALAALSLRELYGVSMGEYADATDYQIAKASELLDDALVRVMQRGSDY